MYRVKLMQTSYVGHREFEPQGAHLIAEAGNSRSYRWLKGLEDERCSRGSAVACCKKGFHQLGLQGQPNATVEGWPLCLYVHTDRAA